MPSRLDLEGIVHFTCRNCGKGFEAGRKDARYCSQACFGKKGRRQNKRTRSDKGVRKPGTVYVHAMCPGCGKEFDRRESDTRKSKNIYCDQECYGKNGSHLTRGGRPRKRPGGKGLPPHAQPETIAAHERWPVKSWFNDNGYTLLYMPDCPYTPPKGDRIYEHRLIMALELGRRLDRNEHVDHIKPLANGGTNARYNLQILTPSEHAKKTASENVVTWRNLAKAIRELGFTPEEALTRLSEDCKVD